MKYVNYHCHSYYSNLVIADSPTSPEEYIARIKELGHTVYCSTEHGISYNWADKYLLCKKEGIKFVYGVEAYIEYENKTYHILFLARNKDGLFEINRMISDGVKNNYKNRRPRITLDSIANFLNPRNVLVTTACIGGVFKEETLELFSHLLALLGHSLMLEVAPHASQRQIELNKKIKELSARYGLQMIAGNDSHYIYPQDDVIRNNVIEIRRISYNDEDSDESTWYMDYPSYDEMFQRFKNQGIWTDEEIHEIIDITNMIEEFEDISFDSSWKVPNLYNGYTPEQRKQLVIDKAYEKWNEYKQTVPQEQHEEYVQAIVGELQEWIKCDMQDYILTANKLVEKGVENGGIVTMSGRGSCSSFLTSALFGLTTIDRVQSKVPLLPERFMTADRIISAHSTPDY